MYGIAVALRLIRILGHRRLLSLEEQVMCFTRIRNLAPQHEEFGASTILEAIFNGVNAEAMTVVREFERNHVTLVPTAHLPGS
ncbi:MAG: hypothetical protein AAB619_01235 [Patescibacteria group bacterium]